LSRTGGDIIDSSLDGSPTDQFHLGIPHYLIGSGFEIEHI
jgi:hypothetical protein